MDQRPGTFSMVVGRVNTASTLATVRAHVFGSGTDRLIELTAMHGEPISRPENAGMAISQMSCSVPNIFKPEHQRRAKDRKLMKGSGFRKGIYTVGGSAMRALSLHASVKAYGTSFNSKLLAILHPAAPAIDIGLCVPHDSMFVGLPASTLMHAAVVPIHEGAQYLRVFQGNAFIPALCDLFPEYHEVGEGDFSPMYSWLENMPNVFALSVLEDLEDAAADRTDSDAVSWTAFRRDMSREQWSPSRSGAIVVDNPGGTQSVLLPPSPDNNRGSRIRISRAKPTR